MLIYSMGVSVDGFIADRAGAFGWTVPNEEQFVSTSSRHASSAAICAAAEMAAKFAHSREVEAKQLIVRD